MQKTSIHVLEAARRDFLGAASRERKWPSRSRCLNASRLGTTYRERAADTLHWRGSPVLESGITYVSGTLGGFDCIEM